MIPFLLDVASDIVAFVIVVGIFWALGWLPNRADWR